MHTSTLSAPLHEAEPCGWSRDDVQRFASKAATQLGYEPGGDIEAIVRRLGGEVVVSDWESAKETGSIQVRGERDFTIYLSPFSGARRSRFTIAPELGHYILHSAAGEKPLFVRRDGSGRLEWEANWFAAGFLMPQEEFVRKVGEGMGDAELAIYFDVSMAAVTIRKQSI